MWQKSRLEETELAKFFLAISEGVSEVQRRTKDATVLKRSTTAVDELVIALSDFDTVKRSAELLERSVETRNILYDRLKIIGDISAKVGVPDNIVFKHISDAKGAFLAWEVLRLERAHFSEVASVFALCFLTIVAVLAHARNSFLSDLYGMVFSTTVAYLVFKIFEYNRTPTMRNLGTIALFQKLLADLGLEFYVADENILKSTHVPASLGHRVRVKRGTDIVSIDVDSGQWAPREFQLARVGLSVLIAFGVAGVFLLLAIKHGILGHGIFG